MSRIESDSFRATREGYERRFINAESTYDRYLIFRQLMSWIEDLTEINDHKDVRIAQLEKEIKGYDLKEYIDDAD